MSVYLSVSLIGSNQGNFFACTPSTALDFSAATAVELPELAIAWSLIVNHTPPPKKLRQSKTNPMVGTRPKRLHVGRYPRFLDSDELVIPNSSRENRN